jgi:hypothetical protein
VTVATRLAEHLRAEGGPVAGALSEPLPPWVEGPGPRAASGPRTAAQAPEYELLIEAIYEGYLLHYGRSRLVDGAEADLRLLAGDRLYALGLDRLVALGDVEAVAELADVISLCAVAHASGDAELARAAWEAGAVAVGWGPTPAHRAAKAAARAGRPGAAEALRAAAREACAAG